MIHSYPIQNPFVFMGNKYENLSQFRDQLTVIDKDPAPMYSIAKDSHNNLFLVRFQLYPCFDSSDWMYENRYYRYLFYCRDHDELDVKLKYLEELSSLGTGAQRDPKLIPNLFYGEDTLFLETAETE